MTLSPVVKRALIVHVKIWQQRYTKYHQWMLLINYLQEEKMGNCAYYIFKLPYFYINISELSEKVFVFSFRFMIIQFLLCISSWTFYNMTSPTHSSYIEIKTFVILFLSTCNKYLLNIQSVLVYYIRILYTLNTVPVYSVLDIEITSFRNVIQMFKIFFLLNKMS